MALLVIGTTAGTARADAGQDQINMHTQEKTQWCWVASGLTIAQFQNYGTTQADFCKRAAKRSRWVNCDNQPATLDDMAGAWADLGMTHTGTGLNRAATFDEIKNDVRAGRPVAARIGWAQGGGHMNVVYGYETGRSLIGVADPWPQTNRYTWWKYSEYVKNRQFAWTHSRTGISR
ncbi:papain-like cysteine protease family protein [Kitasatospora viridis]|nr:papain-like cysteine protease family protein [Kitasatospora viridis]